MTVLVIGSRPPAFASAAARLGIDYDVVYDPEETPRAPAVAPRRTFWLPYLTQPEAVFAVPRLDGYDGVVSFVDFGAMPAALVGTVFALPGPSVEAVLRTRNKHLMRTTLRRHGLAQPEFGLLGHDEPAPQLYPLVVKPLDGTGSSGLRLVGSAAELGVVPPGRPMMWESYVPGPQYTVEGIAGDEHDSAGHRAIAVTGKVVSGPPHFVVLDHETPADLDASTRDLITGYAARCLAALGVRNAATHTEVVLRDGEPMLIETHTRPAGDRVPYLAQLTTGWDQCELALCAASRTELHAAPHPVVGEFARTVHLTPYDSDRTALADPRWLHEFPEVVTHDFSRVFSNRVSAHDSRWGYDPRWGHVVIAGPDRSALATTAAAIRARTRR